MRNAAPGVLQYNGRSRPVSSKAMRLFVTNNGRSSALSVATEHGYAVASAVTGPWAAPRLVVSDNGQVCVEVPNAVFVVTATSCGVTINTVRGRAVGAPVAWGVADSVGFACTIAKARFTV